MANSSWSTSFLHRRTLWLAVALVLLTSVPLGTMPAAADASQISVETTCGPNTFRPDEWVVFECVVRFANRGDTPVSGDVISSLTSSRGVIPEYFFMWETVDGRPVPIGTEALSFGGEGNIAAGQTIETRVGVLLRMPREGAYESDWQTMVVDEILPSTGPLRFEAKSDAAEPPENLLVTKKLVDPETAEGSGTDVATYETMIANEGSEPATALTITDRADFVELIEAQPAPAGRADEFHLVTWDLASFGKKSLAPGESIVVRMTYGPIDEPGCSYASSGVVVEAEVDGRVERYGTRPREEALVGDCDYDNTAGGRGGPVAFGSGGEGPIESTFDFVWAAMFLATGGAALVGLATFLRRRLRR